MKRALVLSGGGSKGAYQVGAVSYLLGVKKIDYDIFCGVSVGALNCSLLAMHASGQEAEASMMLSEMWQDIKTSDVRKRWFPFGILHALWKPSLYNSKPLIDLVSKRMDVTKLHAAKKMLAVGAVSLTTGKYRVFTHKESCIKDAVLASSSFPAMLCPIKIDNELWTDGGVRDITPIKAAIDLGADEIDIVMTSPSNKNASFDSAPNVIDVAMQSIDIMSDEVLENDIKIATLITELVSLSPKDGKRPIKLRILRPSVALPGKPLDFEHEDIDKMMKLGRKEAESAGWEK